MTCRAWVAAAAVLMFATPAAAEVSIASPAGTVSVEIVPSARGPWAPVTQSATSPLLLNITGDVQGDLYPGTKVVGNQAMAAWIRPSDSTLRWSIGSAGGWSAGGTTAAQFGGGVPVAAVVQDATDAGWVVAWQAFDATTPGIDLIAIASNGSVQSPVHDLGSGLLAGGAAVHSTLNIIVAAQDGSRLSARPVLFGGIGPLPTPESRFEVFLANLPVPAAGPTAPGAGSIGLPVDDSAPVIVKPTNGRRTKTPIITAPVPVPFAGDVRVHERVAGSGEAYALVTWWMGPYELEYVELDENGPVLPVERLQVGGGKPPYAEIALGEAILQVSLRH